MTSDSLAAGNAASPEVAKRPAIIPGKFQDHAEAAWDAWYEPEHDMARFMATSPYDKMREAFAAGFAVAAAAERERIREFNRAMADEGGDAFVIDLYSQAIESGKLAERERIIGVASQLRASFPADHPKGAQASFADYLRLTSADRLEATDG